MIEYSKRLAEVDEILNYLSEEYLNKIPEDVRQAIKIGKDKEYIWKYDENKTFKEQNLNRDTIAILAYLNTQYLLNKEQKEVMEQIYEMNEKKAEEEKKEKYKTEELFKESEKKQENNNTQNKSMVKHKESFFKRLMNKIKNIFN